MAFDVESSADIGVAAIQTSDLQSNA